MSRLVSIIIAAHNARQWVREAVHSALGQTYPRCEVLVVDDGSTDGTGPSLAREYGTRLRVLAKAHGGLASARNLALRHAQGEYIQFLDADDLLRPEKVAVHAAYLDTHPDVDVVYSHCLLFRHSAPLTLYDWPRWPRYEGGHLFASMLDEGFLLTHMPLSRRACLERAGGFDEALPGCVDWDYWLRVAWHGAVFAYLDGPAQVLYRVRPESLSAAGARHGESGLRVLAKVAGYVHPLIAWRGRLSRARGSWRFRYGKALAESGRRGAGLWEMACGMLTDRRALAYKLGLMTLHLTAGPRRAALVLGWWEARKTAARATGAAVGQGALR